MSLKTKLNALFNFYNVKLNALHAYKADDSEVLHTSAAAETKAGKLTLGDDFEVVGTSKQSGIYHEATNIKGIIAPEGGIKHLGSPNTGAVRIDLPFGLATTSTMICFWIDLRSYFGSKISIFVNGYTGSSTAWADVSAVIIGGDTSTDLTIRFGEKNGKACVWIGETTSSWSHLEVSVRNVTVGFKDTTMAWEKGWNIAMDTSVTGSQVALTNNLVASDWNKLKNKPDIALEDWVVNLLAKKVNTVGDGSITGSLTITSILDAYYAKLGWNGFEIKDRFNGLWSIGTHYNNPRLELRLDSTDPNYVGEIWIYGAGTTTLEKIRIIDSNVQIETGYLTVGTTDPEGHKLNVSGTAKVSSDLTANKIIKQGGTASQVLLADGTTGSLYQNFKLWLNGVQKISINSGQKLEFKDTSNIHFTYEANGVVKAAVQGLAQSDISGLVDALGGKMGTYNENTSGKDVDTMLTAGSYRLGNNNPNAFPHGNFGNLLVLREPSLDSVAQVGCSYTHNGEVYTRSGNTSTTHQEYIGGKPWLKLMIDDGSFNPANFAKMNVSNTGDFTVTGNVTASSDRRLKKNIKPIGNAMEKITKLNGSVWQRKDTGQKQTGLIAQEVEKVLPEAVQKDKDGYRSLAYGNMVGLLVEGMKEQQQSIKELKERIKTLEDESR